MTKLILLLPFFVPSINEYLRQDEETRRPKLLERLHRRQIVFSCGQPPASVTRRGEEKKAVAFIHRGVFHIMCPGGDFGKEVFSVNVMKLLTLPDEEDLVYVLSFFPTVYSNGHYFFCVHCNTIGVETSEVNVVIAFVFRLGVSEETRSEWLQELLGRTGRHRMSGSLSRTSSGCSTWTNGSGLDVYVQPALVTKKS